MNIDDIKKALDIVAMLQSPATQSNSYDPFLDQYVIVRTYSAGVFAGTLKARNGNKVILENTRRLWRWHTANYGVSLSEVAVHGINQDNSKISCVEPLKEVEPIEISLASELSRKSIEGAKDYVA